MQTAYVKVRSIILYEPKLIIGNCQICSTLRSRFYGNINQNWTGYKVKEKYEIGNIYVSISSPDLVYIRVSSYSKLDNNIIEVDEFIHHGAYTIAW